jgi:formylglycine-generating enzyme required for sulfatase activity
LTEEEKARYIKETEQLKHRLEELSQKQQLTEEEKVRYIKEIEQLKHRLEKPSQKQEPIGTTPDIQSNRPSEIIGSGKNFIETETDMEFIWIAGGCFDMGQSDEEKHSLIEEIGTKRYEKYYSDAPQRRVCVNSFQMGKYEVTNAQFIKFLNEKKQE